MIYQWSLFTGNDRSTLHIEPWQVSHARTKRESRPWPQLILRVENHEPPDFFFTALRARLQKYFPGCRELRKDVCRKNLELQWPEAESGNNERTLEIITAEASPDRYGRIAAEGYTDLIFRTPLYRLNPAVWGNEAEVLVKLESMEPGSVKDRTVYWMLKAAVEKGEIDALTEVVEASSGNVAMAVSAILPTLLKRKPLIFISRMHGPVKAGLVRRSGCPVCLTPAETGTAGAKEASVQYAKKHGAWQLNQHGNPDNPEVHRVTTGPEMYHQCFRLTGQAPAEFVTSVGSGGTAVGIAMYRDEIGADYKVIGVEPEEASLLTGGTFHAHGFSGTAPGFITPIIERDRDRIDGIMTVSRAEGYAVCRKLFTEEGLLTGPSTGASVAAALRRAALPENRGRVIVTMAHDRGDRYLDIEDLYTASPAAFEVDFSKDFLSGKKSADKE